MVQDSDIEDYASSQNLSGGIQKLPNDIFWRVARDFLDTPGQVLRLAQTSRSLWQLLEREIYAIDVRSAQTWTRETAGHKFTFDIINDEIEADWNGPITPIDGRFPDEVTWPSGQEPQQPSYGEEPQSPTVVLPAKSDLTALQWSAITGNVAAATKSIEVAKQIWPEYLEFKDPHVRHAAIHFAAMYGQIQITRLLIQNGCDVNAPSGYTCMAPRTVGGVFRHINPRLGFINLAYEFSQPESPFLTNALGFAILRGHEGLAVELAERYERPKPNPDKIVRGGLVPPLHLAAYVGMQKVVDTLLEKGADPSEPSIHMQFSSALMWAATSDKNSSILHTLINQGVDLEAMDIQGRTALFYALQFEAPKTAYYLISQNLPVDRWIFSNGRWSEFNLSLRHDMFLDCAQLIYEKHPEMPPGFLKKCVQSAFLNALEPGSNFKILQWLIDQDIGLGPFRNSDWADLPAFHARDTSDLGRSALHHAAEAPDVPAHILELVLKKRPQDIDAKSADGGETPLNIALGWWNDDLKENEYEKAVMLLKHGADTSFCTPINQDVCRAIKAGEPFASVKKLIARLWADSRAANNRRKSF